MEDKVVLTVRVDDRVAAVLNGNPHNADSPSYAVWNAAYEEGFGDIRALQSQVDLDNPAYLGGWCAGYSARRDAQLPTADAAVTKTAPAALPSGTETVGGKTYWRDARGGLMPESGVKAQDKLQDETVRKIMGYAIGLSEQVARFKGHTFEDLNGLKALFDQEYGGKLGGKKGNTTFMSFDGLLKVQVHIADKIDFGPELQSAKKLIDECLIEFSSGSHDAIIALINRVFAVESEGRINRADLFSLEQRYESDPR
jgi:Protein of unknown function (DUF3164)